MPAETDPLPLFVWGAGGHALVVADIVREQGLYAVAAFYDPLRPAADGGEYDRTPLVTGTDRLADLWALGARAAAIGVGRNDARLRLAAEAEAAGFALPVVVHPRATVARSAVLGPGTVVAAGAVVNPAVTAGRCVVVNTAAGVDHECRLGDGVMIGPGARLAGNVTVGAAAWVGIGAVVRERVTIGAGSLIGAGAVVVRDVPPGVVAVGVPARAVREVQHDGS